MKKRYTRRPDSGFWTPAIPILAMVPPWIVSGLIIAPKTVFAGICFFFVLLAAWFLSMIIMIFILQWRDDTAIMKIQEEEAARDLEEKERAEYIKKKEDEWWDKNFTVRYNLDNLEE